MSALLYRRLAILSFLLACLLSALPACPQSAKVSGKLKDSLSGKPVPDANVVIKNHVNRVIHFSISNAEGVYQLSIPDTMRQDILFVEVHCLGYKTIRLPLEKGRNTYDFLLRETAAILKDVEVKTRQPIKTNGDTLSYDVNAFSRREDRSIGDVIRHLPGMSVDENGQISYNGKNISNLYIHGDDLMDGRYGLATRTITKEMIRSVDVLQNFQPIRVLKDKVLTNNVAVNLVLKDENSLKLSGQAMLGAGLPEQFDAALNLMLFNKKFKTLNSLKANNCGIDYRNDFIKYGDANFLNDIDNSRTETLLYAATAGNPNIPRQNYYLNTSGVLNANILYNTKDSLQLKANLQVYADRNTFNYASHLTNYLPNDTIRYDQFQNAVRKPFVLNLDQTVQINRTKYYFVNKLGLNFSGNNEQSEIGLNGSAFSQRLHGRIHDFSNDISWVPLLRNRDIISLRWYVNYYELPQNLYIGKGLDSAILNNGNGYAATSQDAGTKGFFSNVSAAYLVGGTRLINQAYETGVITEKQQLNSELSLTQFNGTVSPYKGDAGNALHWERNKTYISAAYNIKKLNWQASISLPLFWQSIHYYQDAYLLREKSNRVFFNPEASARLYTNAEDFLSANYRFNNNMGNIAGVYRGIILTNYLSLTANDAGLMEKHSSVYGLAYNFQRLIIMLFMNASITFSKVTANSVLSTVLTNDIQKTVLLPYENDQNNIVITAGISKYIFSLRTKLSLGSSWRRGYFNQFMNGQLLPFANDAYTFHAGVDGKFLDNFTYAYTGNGNWSVSRQNNNGTGARIENRFKRFDQEASVGYAPPGGFFLNVKGRHMYSTQVNVPDISYFFMDANIRYRNTKLHTDFELGISNLFDVKDYKVLVLSSNQFTVNSYGIRGRMLIFRATFNL